MSTAFQIYQYLFAAAFALFSLFCFSSIRNWKEHIFLGGFGIGAVSVFLVSSVVDAFYIMFYKSAPFLSC